MNRRLQRTDRRIWTTNPTLFPEEEIGIGSDVDDVNYTWLLRSMDPRATAARARLEDWFGRFPADATGKWDLFRRFSSDDAMQHVAAYWELSCCVFLQRHGLEVEVHPDAGGGKSTHSDFRAFRNGAPVVDLECRVLEGPMEDQAEKSRMHDFMATLQTRVTSPKFWVHVQYLSRGKTAPSGSKVAARIMAELDCAGDDPPEDFELEQNGWVFAISVYSKNGAVVDGDRAIAGSGWGDTCGAPGFTEAIKESLRAKKAGRYGVTDVPYVIALNSRTHITDDYVEYALYGDLTVIQEIGLRRREPNGFFSTANTHVSAVLWVWDAMPSNSEEKEPALWHNPNAVNPLNPEDWSCQQITYCPESDTIERIESPSSQQR